MASLSLSLFCGNTEFLERNIQCFFQLLGLLSECLRSHGFRCRRDRSSVAVVIRYIENRYYWSGVVIVSGCRPEKSSVVVRHNSENLWKRSGVVVMVSFVGETDPPQLFGILRIAGAASRR